MSGTKLHLSIDPDVLEKLRAKADALREPLAVYVRRLILQHVDPSLAPPVQIVTASKPKTPEPSDALKELTRDQARAIGKRLRAEEASAERRLYHKMGLTDLKQAFGPGRVQLYDAQEEFEAFKLAVKRLKYFEREGKEPPDDLELSA